MKSEQNPNHLKTRRDEMDDFWDISSLIVKPKQPSKSHPSFDTSTAEITLETVSSSPAKTQKSTATISADAAVPLTKMKEGTGHRPSPVKAPKPMEEIIPQPDIYRPHHPLIEEVKIFPWRNQFPYYERFCELAQALLKRHGEPCNPVSFFSYMPQYDQMNHAQLDWYLYWRDSIHKGEYPNTDYSYIFLLIFEIINLPENIPPEQGLHTMCRVWLNYRKQYPLLNHYLSEWICDYCLIHHLDVPAAILGNAMSEIAEESHLKEFYIGPVTDDTATDATIYIKSCSNYDYKKSKVYMGDAKHAALYDRHIPAALSAVLQSLTPGDHLFRSIKMQTSTLTRDAFIGALCSFRIKRKIEIQHRSFSRSHELRFLITDIVKYSENKLRAALGLKSRLSIYALPEGAKKTLDAYFLAAFPKNSGKEPAAAIRPDYEKLYDLPKTPLSAEAAEKIEQSSWDTTQQLIQAFEDDVVSSENEPQAMPPVETAIPILIPTIPKEDAIPHQETKEHTPDGIPIWLSSISGADLFLEYALEKNTSAQRRHCRNMGKMPEMIADAINESAADAIGDILLEEDGCGGFCVIDDYKDTVYALLNKNNQKG